MLEAVERSALPKTTNYCGSGGGGVGPGLGAGLEKSPPPSAIPNTAALASATIRAVRPRENWRKRASWTKLAPTLTGSPDHLLLRPLKYLTELTLTTKRESVLELSLPSIVRAAGPTL
jgi:hypothetical protein